jgi:threonine/homoserine/homoserine lactone efflux protein
VHPDSSRTVKGAMLLGIVLISTAWRFILSVTLLTPFIGRHYERAEPIVERVFGVALCLFGVHLAKRAVA